MAVRRWSANRSHAQQEASREVDGQYADFFLYVFPGGTSHNVTQEVQRVVYTTTTAEEILAHLVTSLSDSLSCA